ncbi:MAG: hypothetical protein H7Z13_05155 [Ferruginibacter sp.]|nr:hypothetical protein [Ferruginibacter sp.]
MSFIAVTADPCNPQGHTSSQIPRSDLQLNVDLIGAIRGNEVLLKGDDVINLGGHYFKNFKLARGVQIPN